MEADCDNCGIFMSKDREIICCGTCRCAFYCCEDCLMEDYETKHEDECFDMKIFHKICLKLQKAGLIRHVNGNTLDNRISNLQRVSIDDALNNKDWTVDAVCHLNKKEFALWRKVRSYWKPHMFWRGNLPN